MATADEYGNPQVRNISAIHYELEAMYFFTARGKNFCRELLADGRVQVLGYTRYKEMIRLAARAYLFRRQSKNIGLTRYSVSSPIFLMFTRMKQEILALCL